MPVEFVSLTAVKLKSGVESLVHALSSGEFSVRLEIAAKAVALKTIIEKTTKTRHTLFFILRYIDDIKIVNKDFVFLEIFIRLSALNIPRQLES